MGKNRRADQLVLQRLLQELRINAKLTQVELAKKLKRPQSFVSKYEHGERYLDILEIREICKVLGIGLISFAKKLDSAL